MAIDSGAGQGSTGDAGEFGAGNDAPNVTFELDLAADASTSPLPAGTSVPPPGLAADPPPASPSPVANWTQEQIQQLVTRAELAERRANEALGYTRPYLEALAQQQQQSAAPKHRSAQELQNDPNATVEDVARFNQWVTEQRMAELKSELQNTARRETSDQFARGLFSSQAVGAGNDFDSVRSRYLEPIYQQNPGAKQLFGAILPDNPAVGEYLVGFLHEMHALAGGGNDPARIVSMVNGIRRAMQTLGSQSSTQADRVNQAARSRAQQILRAGEGSVGGGPKQKVKNFWELNEKEFDAADKQLTGGV